MMEKRTHRIKPITRALNMFPSLKKVPSFNGPGLHSTNQQLPELPAPISARHLNPSVPKLSLTKYSNFKHSPHSSSRGLQGFLSSRAHKRVNKSTSIKRPLAQDSTEAIHLKSVSLTELAETKFPVTATYALQTFGNILTSIEQAEILDYPKIYYMGRRGKRPGMKETGCDDRNGEYLITPGDHVQYRYEVLTILGKGSFGVVCKCIDHKTHEVVALKVIKNHPKYTKQAAVEIKVLAQLNENDPEDTKNIVRMKAHFKFRQHVCIAFELLSLDLYEFLRINKFQGLSLTLVRRFCSQLLKGLEFARSHSVIHCDLKPENILLVNPKSSHIKIIDFGSSCLETEQIYTYIQSRFYRAPEIMLGVPYTPAIDMWSLACVIVELYTGVPLFPGENEKDQMFRIMEVFGVPPAEVLQQAKRKDLFFESNGQPKLTPSSKGKVRSPGTRKLSEFVGSHDQLFLDFLHQIFVWNPSKRMTPDEGLKHPWLGQGLTRKKSTFIVRME